MRNGWNVKRKKKRKKKSRRDKDPFWGSEVRDDVCYFPCVIMPLVSCLSLSPPVSVMKNSVG